MKFKHIFCILLAALTLPAAPALAGPTWTFGPDDTGVLKLEYKGQFQMLYRDTGASPDGDGSASEFNFRRNRLALMGTYGDSFGLYIQTEHTEDVNIGPFSVSDGDESNFQVLDAALRFQVAPAVHVWAGKFKYGFTRENIEACERPLTLDRSLLIRAPYVATRDKGVSVWGELFGNRLQYRADAMNGRSDSLSTPQSNLRYTGRLHISLLDPETGYGYNGTYLGAKKVLTLGAAYQMENSVAFRNILNETGEVDYRAWTVDAFFEYPLKSIGTFTLSAAYTNYDLDEAYKNINRDDGTVGLNGEKNGYYVKAGYLLPKLPLHIFGRYENWSFTELNTIMNQEISWYGVGFNWYLRGQDLKLTIEYSQADFDKEGIFGGIRTEDLKTMVTQLQVVF